MYYVISVLIVIVSVLLILIVLVQNSKGGGLAANFASSNQVMGVRKTTDFLEKATWTLAVAAVVLCLVAAMTVPRNVKEANKSIIEEQIQGMPDPSATQSFPFNSTETDETKASEETE